MPKEIENAYQYCREITRHYAKSFYFSAKFLPKHKQLPIYALYALCRLLDNEVDEKGIENETEAIQAVELWREKLDEVYRIAESRSPNFGKQENLVLIAWADMLKTYKIPQELPLELMKGVLMDTHLKSYETFEELYVYCYRVASVVGLMSSEIFGYQEKETLDYAESLGIAMQLTNILRDVAEDAEMQRIYLPKEDLEKFGISQKQIFEKKFDENFLQMMKFQIERAESYYRKAEKGIPLLEKDSRFAVLAALRIYEEILREIEKLNYNVFQKRASTSKMKKLTMLPRIWLEVRTMNKN